MMGSKKQTLSITGIFSNDRGRRLRCGLLLIMGCLAILSPLFAGNLALFLVGLLLIACGVLQMVETFQTFNEAARRSTYLSGALSVFAGILLLAQPQLLLRGLALFVAASFLVDGFSRTVAALRTRAVSGSWKWTLVSGLINVVLALVLVIRWPVCGGAVLAIQVGMRMLARPLERRTWQRVLAVSDQDRRPRIWARLCRRWLMHRFRFSWRMARARRSPRAALRWGFQVGLPATAILIAVNPIWGFSWFFNSESWAAGIWDRWAAARTDIWREQMILAVENRYAERNLPSDRVFQVAPEGVAGKADFSFLV